MVINELLTVCVERPRVNGTSEKCYMSHQSSNVLSQEVAAEESHARGIHTVQYGATEDNLLCRMGSRCFSLYNCCIFWPGFVIPSVILGASY